MDVPFWQGCWSARSVEAVEVNGYTIEPGANLQGANLKKANLDGAFILDRLIGFVRKGLERNKV